MAAGQNVPQVIPALQQWKSAKGKLVLPEKGKVIISPDEAKELKEGAEILVLPAAWVRGPLKEHHWSTLLAARALDTTCYMVAAGECGIVILPCPVTRDGKTIWPEVMPQQGSFDWTEQRFRQEIPFGVKNVVLVLGLQGATGTVYFKDLKVEVLEK